MEDGPGVTGYPGTDREERVAAPALRDLVGTMFGRCGMSGEDAEYNDALGSARVVLPTHASMYFDGRYKSVVYHGLGLGELLDLEADPGEFDDLWSRRDASDLRVELLTRHFDAIMATSSAGVARADMY